MALLQGKITFKNNKKMKLYNKMSINIIIKKELQQFLLIFSYQMIPYKGTLIKISVEKFLLINNFDKILRIKISKITKCKKNL
jgi:hypothetical protein